MTSGNSDPGVEEKTLRKGYVGASVDQLHAHRVRPRLDYLDELERLRSYDQKMPSNFRRIPWTASNTHSDGRVCYTNDLINWVYKEDGVVRLCELEHINQVQAKTSTKFSPYCIICNIPVESISALPRYIAWRHDDVQDHQAMPVTIPIGTKYDHNGVYECTKTQWGWSLPLAEELPHVPCPASHKAWKQDCDPEPCDLEPITKGSTLFFRVYKHASYYCYAPEANTWYRATRDYLEPCSQPHEGRSYFLDAFGLMNILVKRKHEDWKQCVIEWLEQPDGFKQVLDFQGLEVPEQVQRNLVVLFRQAGATVSYEARQCDRTDAHGPHQHQVMDWVPAAGDKGSAPYTHTFQCEGIRAHPDTTIGGRHDGKPAMYGQPDMEAVIRGYNNIKE